MARRAYDVLSVRSWEGRGFCIAAPKYTLREWMLVEAYSKAGDYSDVHELLGLIKDSYGEGSADDHEKYYRRAPDESLRAGGTAFLS